jgi:hypothetical protein
MSALQLAFFEAPAHTARGDDRPPAQANPPAPCADRCRLSRDGRHVLVDLRGLQYSPSAPFCAWCGPLEVAR